MNFGFLPPLFAQRPTVNINDVEAVRYEILKNLGVNSKILDNRRVTYTDGPQMLLATVKNVVARVTRIPRFMHPRVAALKLAHTLHDRRSA